MSAGRFCRRIDEKGLTMATTSPIFQAGGLASGLDTNSIVDKLVALETLPITKNTACKRR